MLIKIILGVVVISIISSILLIALRWRAVKDRI